MLDLSHPRTPFVFAASKQLDLILDYCKLITLSEREGRRFMLEIIRPAFAALRWLASDQFAKEPHIVDSISELERQVVQLVELPVTDATFTGSERIDSFGCFAGRCPVCRSDPVGPFEYESHRYCPECFGIIDPGLQRIRSCEEGFGTEAI